MKARVLFEAMDKNRVLDLFPPTPIWTAFVTHEDRPPEIIVARTEEALTHELAELCRVWWHAQVDDEQGDLPENNDEAVEQYFESQDFDTYEISEHPVNLRGHESSVWVAVVEHRHGHNVYAATTEDELYRQLAEYCREWWSDVAEIDDEGDDAYDERPPTDPKELVYTYFERIDNEDLSLEKYPLP